MLQLGEERGCGRADVCTYGCGFCAFSKGRLAEDLRGAPYLLPLEEISRRTAEAWERGASEVCMQGGIHPDFTGMPRTRHPAPAASWTTQMRGSKAFSQGRPTCGSWKLQRAQRQASTSMRSARWK